VDQIARWSQHTRHSVPAGMLCWRSLSSTRWVVDFGEGSYLWLYGQGSKEGQNPSDISYGCAPRDWLSLRKHERL
jgi:hypothetical protein